ncbi:MAG: S1 RNA-binding domain-containing protein [Clostridiales bacterium]|nr:S1 RNA-binding domain-containing protein [Clostridiales bacterium]
MSIQVGDILEGIVENITNYGAFIKLESGEKGLVHISEVSNKYVNNISEVLELNQKVKVKVLSKDNNKLALSIKQALPKEQYKEKKNNNFKNSNINEGKSFEDILSKFLKDSEERQLDIKRVFESKRGYSSKRA